MTTMRNRIVFSGVINSAHDFKISRTTVAPCPLYSGHKCLKKGQKALTKLDIFQITSKNGNCALESKVLWEIKGGPAHQSTLNFNYVQSSAESANCKYETASAWLWRGEWCVACKLLCSPMSQRSHSERIHSLWDGDEGFRDSSKVRNADGEVMLFNHVFFIHRHWHVDEFTNMQEHTDKCYSQYFSSSQWIKWLCVLWRGHLKWLTHRELSLDSAVPFSFRLCLHIYF